MTARPGDVRLGKGARAPETAPATPAETSPITAAELAPIIGGQDADLGRIEHLIATAWARVLAYAPGAPAAMQREALTRYAGYLYGSDFGGVASEEIGPRKVEYTVNHANAWRNSGAAGCVAPWRVRRAGAIG